MSVTASTDRPPRGLPIPARALGFVADLGGIALLALAMLGSLARRRGGDAPLIGATLRQVSWMVAMAAPLVALIHVSFGSFLAMQAYFGATFTQAAGAVVGLGLIRNVAPLLSGFVMVGLIATRVTSDLRDGLRPGLDDPTTVPDRDVSQGLRPDDRPCPSVGRVALVRVLAAMLAGPVLATLGAATGTMMGLLVARSMLGQSPAMFLGKIVEMLEPTDVVGLIVKPAAFAGMAALLASFEGLRPARDGGPDAYRAALRSVVMVLFLNFTWFNLVYLAGNPYGPAVSETPAASR